MMLIDGQSVEGEPFRFERNESWLGSVWLSLRLVFWWAPTSLWRATRRQVLDIVKAAIVLAVCIVAWLFLRVLILIAGFTGRVSPGPTAPRNSEIAK